MKTWINAEVVELNIAATAEGGKNPQNVDNMWTDRATGDLYLSCGSGGNTEGNPADVEKFPQD